MRPAEESSPVLMQVRQINLSPPQAKHLPPQMLECLTWHQLFGVISSVGLREISNHA